MEYRPPDQLIQMQRAELRMRERMADIERGEQERSRGRNFIPSLPGSYAVRIMTIILLITLLIIVTIVIIR